LAISIPRDVVLTVIGLIAGLAISHFYYAKSIRDMKADVDERKRIEGLMLRGIESIGTIKYNRDHEGNVKGVVIDLKAHVQGESSTSTIRLDVK